MLALIENGTVEDDDEDAEEGEVDEDAGSYSELPPPTEGNTLVRGKIDAVIVIKKKCEEDIKPLNKLREKVTNKITKAQAYLKRLKERVQGLKRARARAGGGIEDLLFGVLKSIYGVKIQAYHGGSLHGKDIQKVMNNAREVFQMFSGILITHKKSDCAVSDAEIESICNRFSNLCCCQQGGPDARGHHPLPAVCDSSGVLPH